MTTLWAAALASGAGAVGGARLGWLTWRGAAAATVVGTLTLAGTGWRGAVPLAVFFISGSVLTRARRRTAERRTARQVAANGGWASVGAALVGADPVLGWCTFTGALAAAQADTWASEIGRRFRPTARRITTGERVPAGRSGAVTLLGTLAGTAGALVVSASALAVGAPLVAAATGVVAGAGGMMVDSVLGDTLQGDEPNRPGPAWFSNDLVNFIATGTAAAAAAGLAWGTARFR